MKQMPPRPTIKEEDIEEAFLKGSGPGGQKINKTSSAVQLKHLPTGQVTKSQATRSRSQNRKIARKLLAEKLEEMEKGPESRRAMKGEVARKRKASKTKKAKRKYRNLDRGDSVTGTSEGIGDELGSDDELPRAGAHGDMIEGRKVNNSDVHRHERAAENEPIR
ncbi:MAG: hypothetical protein M1839_005134 [Geoglossum umbratile]|nr:MAG: hypothetical protein M1839_005134 [Geoglossum umbratile]